MNRHAFPLALIALLLGTGSFGQTDPSPQVGPLPTAGAAAASPGLAFTPAVTPDSQPPPQPFQPPPLQPGPSQPLPPSAMPPSVAPPPPLWQPCMPVTPPAAALSLPEATAPKPETFDDSTSPSVLGMRGMPFGPGGDAGMPGYKALWLPDQAVANQAAHLGMEQQELSLRVPIWKDGPDAILFSTRVRWENFQTDAILPDTGQPFPADLWNVNFGTSYFHRFDNGYLGGASVNLGSASDQPFHSFQEDTASVNGLLRCRRASIMRGFFALLYHQRPTGRHSHSRRCVLLRPLRRFSGDHRFSVCHAPYHPWRTGDSSFPTR